MCQVTSGTEFQLFADVTDAAVVAIETTMTKYVGSDSTLSVVELQTFVHCT